MTIFCTNLKFLNSPLRKFKYEFVDFKQKGSCDINLTLVNISLVESERNHGFGLWGLGLLSQGMLLGFKTQQFGNTEFQTLEMYK